MRCQYEIALPVLDALELTAIWFVYTSPLEGVAERLELYRQFRNVAFDSVGAFYDAFYAQARETDGEEADLALHDLRPEDYLAQYPFYSAADRSFRFVRDEILGPARYNAVMDALIAAKGGTPRPTRSGSTPTTFDACRGMATLSACTVTPTRRESPTCHVPPSTRSMRKTATPLPP